MVRPSRSRPKCNLLLPCANRSHRIIALPSVPAPGCSDSTSISSLSPFARRASPLPAVSIMGGFCGPCKGSCITHPFCPGHRPIVFLHCVPLMILRTPSLSSFAYVLLSHRSFLLHGTQGNWVRQNQRAMHGRPARVLSWCASYDNCTSFLINLFIIGSAFLHSAEWLFLSTPLICVSSWELILLLIYDPPPCFLYTHVEPVGTMCREKTFLEDRSIVLPYCVREEPMAF